MFHENSPENYEQWKNKRKYTRAKLEGMFFFLFVMSCIDLIAARTLMQNGMATEAMLVFMLTGVMSCGMILTAKKIR